MHGRAKISLWNREEEGAYKAELDGVTLEVTWTPDAGAGGVHGFRWHAEGPGGKREADEPMEEIELAMMAAEAAARDLAAKS